jgi:hypothetical protein
MLGVAYREQRLLVRPALDAGEELRELVSGGQERFLFLCEGGCCLSAMLNQNPRAPPPEKPEKT